MGVSQERKVQKARELVEAKTRQLEAAKRRSAAARDHEVACHGELYEAQINLIASERGLQ